MKKELEIPANK
jgi:hypothetical protein